MGVAAPGARGRAWWTVPAVAVTLVAAPVVLTGCAHQEAKTSPPASLADAADPIGGLDAARTLDADKARQSKGVVVDIKAVRAEPKDVLAHWIGYAGDRAALWPALQTKNRAADDFFVEVVARQVLADGWAKDRAKGVAPNRHLDLTVRVEGAGLMPNYVLEAFARPGWFLAPGLLAKLNFPRFRAFAAKQLQGHRPTRPTFYFPENAPVYPRIPGAGLLPAGAAIDPGKVPCRDSAAPIAAALARWASERETFDGVPLAASDRTGFLRAVEKVHAVAPYSDQGVTWVARDVSDLFVVAGFCAVEEDRWTDAERLLREVIALDPLDGGTRGELALVYAHLRRLDDAERVMVDALPLATNNCERARLMRRQGFLQIERGNFMQALQTYGQSLELDPGNAVALKEIEVVLTEMRRQGGEAAVKATGYVPPPASPSLKVTSCSR